MICPECQKGISIGIFDNRIDFVETISCRGPCRWKVQIFYPDLRSYWFAKNMKQTLL